MILSALLMVSASPADLGARDITIFAPVLTVGDLVPGSDLPATIRGRIVLSLSSGDHWMFDGATLASLIRRRVPGIRVGHLEDVNSVSVRLIGDRPAKSTQVCFETAMPVANGQVIGANDLNATTCLDRTVSPHLRFDRANGLAMASAALPAKAYLGAVAPPRRADVARGAALILRSTAGPTVVERKVTAMQPGRHGARIFVRDADGTVFAVPLAVAQSQDSSR